MTVTMSVGHLGFVFLLLFPGLLQAVSTPAQPCAAPSLRDGFFYPDKDTYADGEMLTYTCDDGRKPMEEGWWAACTCQNGKWSHEPQCIDTNSCSPPTVDNGDYPVSQSGWYAENHRILVMCHDGYEIKSGHADAICWKGQWSSLPVCASRIDSCDEPPQVQHAVITAERKEVFAVNSEVQYQCADGYLTQDGGTKKTVTCSSGSWREIPTCSRVSRPTENDSTTSAGRGSGTSSGSTGSNSPMITTLRHCGLDHPIIPDALVVEQTPTSLKYQCTIFYKMVGLETVVCYSDGSWSPLPVCEAAFCTVDSFTRRDLKVSGTQYIKEGDVQYFSCGDRDYLALARCTNKVLQISQCCSRYDHQQGYC